MISILNSCKYFSFHWLDWKDYQSKTRPDWSFVSMLDNYYPMEPDIRPNTFRCNWISSQITIRFNWISCQITIRFNCISGQINNLIQPYIRPNHWLVNRISGQITIQLNCISSQITIRFNWIRPNHHDATRYLPNYSLMEPDIWPNHFRFNRIILTKSYSLAHLRVHIYFIPVQYLQIITYSQGYQFSTFSLKIKLFKDIFSLRNMNVQYTS